MNLFSSMASNLKLVLCSRAIEMPMMIISYLSSILVIFLAAFEDYQIIWILLTLLFDLAHLVKIIAGFYTPFQDEMGEMIVDKAQIKSRQKCQFSKRQKYLMISHL